VGGSGTVCLQDVVKPRSHRYHLWCRAGNKMWSRHSLKKAEHKGLVGDDAGTAATVGLPRRPANRWPLVACLIASIGAIAGTVLFANDGRNLKLLQASLGIKPDVAQMITAAPAPSIEQPAPSWPFIASDVAAPLSIRDQPAATCAALAPSEPDAPPPFVIRDDEWECAFLFPPIGEVQSTLFLQARGSSTETLSVRVKFNLNDGAITPKLASQAVGFAGAFLPLAIFDLELRDKIETRLLTMEDFSLSVDRYRVSFRRELADPTRGNLIFAKRPVRLFDLPRLTGKIPR
jgi:hypothetical protein